MESSPQAGIVNSSEWVLLALATILLTFAVSDQRVAESGVPIEANMGIQPDAISPTSAEPKALAGSHTKIAAVTSTTPNLP